MTSSREQECTDTTLDHLLTPEEFHMISLIEETVSPFAPPLNLPKCSIAMNRFTFLKKDEEDRGGRKSYHMVNTAKKDNEIYFIKHNDPQCYMSELELVCWMWYKLTISHIIPKKAYACYNDVFQFIGIASQEIPGFESNHANPLQEKDLVIDAVEHDFNYQRTRLIEVLTSLSKCLYRPVYGEGILSSLWNCTKYSYNVYCSSDATAAQVYWRCHSFLSPNPDLSRTKLCDLIKMLDARQKHINSFPTSEQYQAESILLEKGIEYAGKLVSLNKNDHVDVLKLEAIDHFAKKNNYVLEKMCDIDKISAQCTSDNFEISVKDLKNYRLIKGVAEGTVASYVNAENDYHSKNGAKDGRRIDFDMSEWEFLSQFKKCNCFEWLFNGMSDNRFIELLNWNKSPNEDPFVFTERDIRNFPAIQDAAFRYWPTKSDLVSKSGLNITSAIFENFYTTENSETFKKLSIHPVFIFHKYKSFLKHILVTEEMFREGAALCMRKNLVMPNSDKNLLEEFISYKLNRMKNLKITLLKMPKFHEFLAKNKENIFQLIQEEFMRDIIEYKNEMEKEGNDHYQKLIKAIDLANMENEYQRILDSINNTETLTQSIIIEDKSSCSGQKI